MVKARVGLKAALLISTVALIGAPRSVQAGQPASAITVQHQKAVAEALPFADRQDFDFADRGFLGTRVDPLIKRADGQVAWNLAAYDFLRGERPATVNPSLWRQAQLLARHGLYQVSDKVWQVRGFDVSNVTFIKGDTGWVVVDPLTTAETARAAFELVSEKLGALPIRAVIYTHSHSDHFGGVRGIVDQKDVEAGKIAIVAAGRLHEGSGQREHPGRQRH